MSRPATELELLRKTNAELRETNAALQKETDTLREAYAALQKETDTLRGKNRELESLLEGQAKEITELKKKVEELERKKNRQAAPFRRKKRKTDPKPPGRKPGHKGSKRDIPENVDETKKAPPLESCPCCGGPVEDVHDHENYETDIPPVQPTVTRFEFQSGWCPHCDQRVHSTHPDQTSTATGAAASHVGPRARALGADFKTRLGIPYRKVCEILWLYFGLKVSAGGLTQSNHRLAGLVEPTLDEMKKELAKEDVVYGDETGWWVKSESWWLWVLCSLRFTIYVIVSHRKATVVKEILGEDFRGWLMRDGMASYDSQLDYKMLRWGIGRIMNRLLRRVAPAASRVSPRLCTARFCLEAFERCRGAYGDCSK